jgi:hypothetical protein
MHQEHFSTPQEKEGSEKEMAWTIDGSPERTEEAIATVVRRLEALRWSVERLENIKKTLAIGIANTITYANHGDPKKSIEVGFLVKGAESGEGSVEISLTGEDKAVEAPSPTTEEADLQGERTGDLFLRLPGIDVTLFPAENKIVLKQGEEAIGE